MKVSTVAVQAALASVAASAAVELNKRVTPLDVKLETLNNSEIKAVVTNNGNTDLNLFIRNSFLDSASIEKAEVYSADSRVAFDGIRQRIGTNNLTSDSFQNIPAGASIEATWDTAEMHDLSAGGDFDILTQGAIPYANPNSTTIVGAVPYLSNRVRANVLSSHAIKVRRNFLGKIEKLKKRSTLTDCSGDKKTSTETAMTNCQKLASAAAEAATSDNAAFTDIFKQADAAEVKKVLTAVAEECGSTTSGSATYYCDQNSVPDEYAVGGCQSQVLAYTMPSVSLVVNCDLYYSALPDLTTTCYDQDQATTTLHEFTHLSEIKGTDDLGYGYSAATQLTGAQALNNADSYALFANAVANSCSGSSSSSSSSSSSDSSTGTGTSTGSGTATTPETSGSGSGSSSGTGTGTGTETGSGIGGLFTPTVGGGSSSGSGTETGSGIGGIFTPIAGGSSTGTETGSGFGGIFTPIAGGSSPFGGESSGTETGSGIGAIFTPPVMGGAGSGSGSSSSSEEDSSSSSGFGSFFSWPPSWLSGSSRRAVRGA
ncbi:neutral protease 2 [Diplodia corticola]|uniref:Neutral protease 2 n=1 Tax=Diplodia corticola TaxID=236234 RepID=A0A1J9SJQ9_9PEZI|nr:neutral protease 2 [Diplodia corticola]OJD40575.1 neutral protease 2 [Diplodia corticola]